MKQLISIFVFILIGTVLAEGEEMKFVTVLSSPVGTFAQLETANPTRAVQSPVVNFGTSRVTVGRMELKGAAGYIEDLSLQSGTELGGNAGAYRVAEGMKVSGGRITGGRLMANEVDFSGALEGKSEVKGSLYIDEIAVAGAKADSLTIPEEVELTASSGEEEVLEWSNAYDCDYEITKPASSYTLTIGDWQGCWVTGDSCDGHMLDNYDDRLDEIKANPPTYSFSCVDMAVDPSLGVQGIFDARATDYGPLLYHPIYPADSQYTVFALWYQFFVRNENECWALRQPYYMQGWRLSNQECPGIGPGEPVVEIDWTLTRHNVATPKVEESWKYYLASQKFQELEKYIVQFINDKSDYDGWLQIGCAGPCRAEKGWFEYYLPVIYGHVRVYCRQIDYEPIFEEKKAKCKPNSPKYDSYLLKSTTSSSDSKEEGTEG